MTGREKLIEWAKNISLEELAEDYCPHNFGLNDDYINQCSLFEDCKDCWQQAIEKEYPDE